MGMYAVAIYVLAISIYHHATLTIIAIYVLLCKAIYIYMYVAIAFHMRSYVCSGFL